MKSYDAIVVGAGPGGSTCAERLKKSGLDVKLFDKKVFPRVKPCAGWVTPQVIEALHLDVDNYQRENTFQPITSFRTGIIGGPMIETQFHQPVSFGIRRIEFDNYLLQRSGVSCEFQTVKEISRTDGNWQVNGTDRAPLIVGAGGHFCPVARMTRSNAGAISTSRTRPATVYAQEIEFEAVDDLVDGHVHPEIPELYFCNDLQGYGWCFRKGNFLNVGLGRLEKAGLSKRVKEFWEFLRSRNKVVGQLPGHFLGHAYRLYAERAPKLFDEGLLLIGDSAGLAYPHSGEGIRPAIESALIAADVITNVHGDFTSESLSEYHRRIVQRLGRPKPYQTASWLPAAWLQKIAARLMATHWFAKTVVVDNWFLNRRQKALKI